MFLTCGLPSLFSVKEKPGNETVDSFPAAPALLHPGKKSRKKLERLGMRLRGFGHIERDLINPRVIF